MGKTQLNTDEQLYRRVNNTFDISQFKGGDRINHFFVPILNQLTPEEIQTLIDCLQKRLNARE